MATKKKEKVYNLNEMRETLLSAHKTGNKSLISAKFAIENGASEGFYKTYISKCQALYEQIVLYVRTKHATTIQISEYGGKDEWQELLASQRNDIFPLWKDLLECGEKTKTAKSLHIIPADVDSLIGYAEMFMGIKNTPLDSDEQIDFPKAIAPQTFSKFRKSVETLLGIRIAEQEVLTDEQRDFLLAERRAISTIKRKKQAIAEKLGKIDELERLKKFIKNNEELARINSVIEQEKAILSGTPESGDNLETQLANAKATLKDLYDKNGVSTKGLDL